MLKRLDFHGGRSGGAAAPAASYSARGYTLGWLLLALGIVLLAIVFGLAMGVRQAVLGRWPHTGLLVVTYVPEAAPRRAAIPAPAGATSEAREVDLSVSQVRALLKDRQMVNPSAATRVRASGMVRLEPSDAEREYNLALAYLEQGDLYGALKSVSRAIALRPADAEAYGLRAQIHIQRGEREAAVQDLDQVLALEPGQPEAVALRYAILQAGQR